MIVVVDDDAALVQLIQELLESEGYEVRVAGNGAEAYHHVRDPKCKAVLLDIHMPGINGPELLMLMVADGVRVPVILMTSDPGYQEDEMKQFPNVQKLLHKPLYPEDVVVAVRRAVSTPVRASKS